MPKINNNELPKTIRILDKRYSLESIDPDTQITKEHNQGVINFVENHIRYVDSSPKDSADTIIHECLHGIIHGFNMEFENEEDVVVLFTRGLVLLMEDNPNLLPILQDMINKGSS